MTTNNAVNTTLSGQTGTGAFVGSINPTFINYITATNTVARSNSSSYTLTVASDGTQAYTGTGITADKVVMPNTTTLSLTMFYYLINFGNTTLLVTASDGTTITTIPSNYSVEVFVTNTATSTNTSWDIIYPSPQPVNTLASPTYAGLTLTNPYIAGAGGLHSFQVFTSGTAATYTRPSNVTSILVEVVGGGGGSGGCSGAASSNSCSGGGGAGGYARLFVASAASTYTYTVGAAGSAGASGVNTGGTGGTTTFSASSLQATGGVGGTGGTATLVSAVSAAAGGAGGVGSNGNFNAAGAPGSRGWQILGFSGPGLGGSSHYGGGGAESSGAGLYGSGGGGQLATTSNVAGNAGSSGIIIVWEFA
jgi:hypothetical protein